MVANGIGSCGGSVVSSSSALYSERTRSVPTIQLRQLVAGMAPMLLLYILYTVIRFLVKDRGPVEGIRNGYEVLHLEQRLGLDWELSLQEVMLPHEWLVKAANWYYVIGFLPVILACASIAAILDFRTFLW